MAQDNDAVIAGTADETFKEFYSDVKEIEKRDSVLTPKQQIDRLTRPGATYFNLNPYEVLQVDDTATLNEIKVKYRRMAILVHPDKNIDDKDRAQKSFEAVNKAWKSLNDEDNVRKCREVIDEAKVRVADMMKQKRKQLKKEGKPQIIPEDQESNYKHSVYVQTCKLFADIERLQRQQEAKDMHEKKRKAEEEADEVENKKIQKEWDKNFEESRAGRVSSWRDFNKSGKSSKKHKKEKSHSVSRGGFKPPKTKAEQR